MKSGEVRESSGGDNQEKVEAVLEATQEFGYKKADKSPAPTVLANITCTQWSIARLPLLPHAALVKTPPVYESHSAAFTQIDACEDTVGLGVC